MPPAGWRAYLLRDPREDEEPVVVTYCPECARREFSDRGGEQMDL